jgi:hypothetical protein
MSKRVEELYRDVQAQLAGLRLRVLSLLEAACPDAVQDAFLLRLSLDSLRAQLKDFGWYRCGLARSRQRRRY